MVAIRTRWSGGSSSVLSRELADGPLARSSRSIRKTRCAPRSGLNCARSRSRRICWIVIWRSGPSGAKVMKSGMSGKQQRIFRALFGGPFLALLDDFDVFREAEIVVLYFVRVVAEKLGGKARASVAFPTPSGPLKRIVCGMRAAAIAWRRGLRGRQIAVEVRKRIHFRFYFRSGSTWLQTRAATISGRIGAVDQAERLRLQLGDLPIAAIDALMKRERLPVETIARQIAPVGPLQAGRPRRAKYTA